MREKVLPKEHFGLSKGVAVNRRPDENTGQDKRLWLSFIELLLLVTMLIDRPYGSICKGILVSQSGCYE
jgi:hypothetical protein